MASNPTIDSFTADIQALRQELRGLKDELSDLSGGAMGGGSMMPSSLGRVSSNAFGAFDTTSPYGGMGALAVSRTLFGKALTGAGLGLVASGAISSVMPNMEKYTVRESGYYMSALYSMGSSGRADLRDRTQGTLTALGGLTSVGADATVAAILSGRGVNTNSSYYNTLVRQIGNVGRYMNMENEVAAQSMANLTGGRTSASLLQRGIFTSNPLTGQSLKESDIFEQFARRVIVGDMSVAETQDELRRGFLGANIESLDIDAAAKERLKMYLIARAGGQQIDFSSGESMAKAFGPTGALKEYTNPFATIYGVNAMETQAIEGVTTQYNQGLVAGAAALQELYNATENLRNTFAKLNAGLALILGNDLGATLGNPLTALAMYSAAGMSNAVTDVTTGGTSFQNQFGGLLGGLAGLFGITIPTTDSSGGGGDYDDSNIGAFALPVPAGSKISSGFGASRLDPSGRPLAGTDGTHDGIDYAVAEGTPIRAAYDGSVAAVRRTDPGTGYGIYVKLQHGEYHTIYGHLRSVKDGLEVGSFVRQGDVIGYSGNTGNSSGPHLHFEVRKNDEEIHPSQFSGVAGFGGGEGNSASGNLTAGYKSLLSTVLSGPSGSRGSSSAGLLLSSSSGSMASPTTVVSGGGNSSVTINLTIASASEAEAVRFAELVKQKIEEESFVAQMGAR